MQDKFMLSNKLMRGYTWEALKKGGGLVVNRSKGNFVQVIEP